MDLAGSMAGPSSMNIPCTLQMPNWGTAPILFIPEASVQLPDFGQASACHAEAYPV